MVAAKEKTVSFKSHSNIQRMDSKSAHPTATKTTPTVINRISTYDFTTRKNRKPHYGSSEKIRPIVPVENQQRPRKNIRSKRDHVRRLHRAPELSFYRAYFVPGEMDPEGLLSVKIDISNVEEPQECGGFQTQTLTFGFDGGKAPCDGYFVQKVSIRCQVGPCDDCPSVIPEPTVEFFELFDPKEVDHSSFKLLDETCGIFFAHREVRFFCKKDIKEEVDKWKPIVKPLPKCNTTLRTGDQNATEGTPTFWKPGVRQEVGQAYHWHKGFWDCCDECPDREKFAEANHGWAPIR